MPPTTSPLQDLTRPGCHNSHSPVLATSVFIPVPRQTLHPGTSLPQNTPRPPHATLGMSLSSQSTPISPHGLIFGWSSRIDKACSTPGYHILSQSRRACYQVKWKHFSAWLTTITSEISIYIILAYLLEFKMAGFTFTSIWVHLAALSTFFHVMDSASVFPHPTTIS